MKCLWLCVLQPVKIKIPSFPVYLLLTKSFHLLLVFISLTWYFTSALSIKLFPQFTPSLPSFPNEDCNWPHLHSTVRVSMQICHSKCFSVTCISRCFLNTYIHRVIWLHKTVQCVWVMHLKGRISRRMFCIPCPFKGFGITERPQLSWRCDALWWELRLTGLPSLPTVQPFIKSMPPLNTTLPCGAGPCYSLLPLLVWGGKHRQTDKLEPLQLPSSHPLACLLLWSDNSTVSNMKQNHSSFETRTPAFKLHSLQPIIFSFLYRTVSSVKIIVIGLICCWWVT